MKDWSRRNRSRTRHPFGIPDGLETIFGDENGLAGNYVMEMLGRMLRQVMGSSVEESGFNTGRGPEGTRPRRRVPGGGSDHARMELSSALHAARAEILGEGYDDDNIRPVIISEAIFSPHLDLQSDRDDSGNGLGSTETIADVAENAELDVAERLGTSVCCFVVRTEIS